MIGSITKGSDFSGCVRYALAVDEPGKEARLLYAEGVLSDTPQDIINGFECQRHLNQRVQHWVGHISLSYSPEDSAILTDDKMVKFALEYMERMGIKNTQFIIARHLDKEHPHCHIVFNRVDNDGKCVSDSWEYFRSNDICKELKLKYGLTFGEGRDKVKTHRLKGRERAKQEVYIAVRDALKAAKDWTTFQRELAKSGVSLRKKYRRGTTIVEGLSFVKGKHKFKASEVAKKRKFSFANIDRILNENKNGRPQTASAAPLSPRVTTPKQEPSIASKVIEAGLEIGENLAEGLGGLFKLGPGYDPEQEAMNNEMERRRKRPNAKAAVFNDPQKDEKMTNENVNSSEDFLGNIAEELGTLSGTCNEIKEAQLNCATTDDLAKFKDELDNNLVLYTHAIRTSTENCEGAVNQSADQICDSITEFKDDFDQKLDDFRANPPVQKVEKTICIARESWQWYLTLGFTIFSTLLFFAMIFWQEGRIEQCRISDIKYHYILMNEGVGTVGLDSIESWFNDPKKVKQIEAEVRAYEERVQETARALDQKHRLEEKINELNTQPKNSKK